MSELRSILKQGLPFVALTATATAVVRKTIIDDLSMRDCVEMLSLPDKPNTRYSVSAIDSEDLYGAFSWLISELEIQQRNARKVLIFCRKRSHVRELYEVFDQSLGPKGYVLPTGKEPMDDRTRLYAMYHKKTHMLVKQVVEKEIVKPNGSVRVVFCTIAFGMGVDVKGAELVIHMGPSSALDDYLQECGRVGRDSNSTSHAVLLKYSGSTRSKNITKPMKEYVRNSTVCRRVLLMKPFSEEAPKAVIGHSCCDICAESCACLCTCPESNCTCVVKCDYARYMSPIEIHLTSLENKESSSIDTSTEKYVTSKERCVAVRSDLLSYRAQLANNIPHDKLLTGLDLATGFSRGLIEKIVAEINSIDSLETLVQQFSFFCDDHAKATWEIISHCIAESDSGSDESINDDTNSDGSSNSDDGHSDLPRICLGYSSSDSE